MNIIKIIALALFLAAMIYFLADGPNLIEIIENPHF